MSKLVGRLEVNQHHKASWMWSGTHNRGIFSTWTVTDDSLQVCTIIKKKFETPITQRKILSLVSSVSDRLDSLIRLAFVRQFWNDFSKAPGLRMKNTSSTKWTGKEAEFLMWKQQPIVPEISIDRRYSNKSALRKDRGQKQSSSNYNIENNLAKRWNNKIKLEKNSKKQQNPRILTLSGWEGLIRTKTRTDKSILDCNTLHLKLLYWKHHAFELLLQNEPKSEQPKGAEHVRNNILQKMWILGVRKALQSIKDNCVTFTKGQNRSDSASDGRYTRIVVRWFNSLYDCCSWLPWLFHWEVWAKERKSMNYMFTSLTLRAVSPEVAPKLDIESCLNLLKQLIAGRGEQITITIFSDNGRFLLQLNKNLPGTLLHGTNQEFCILSKLFTQASGTRQQKRVSNRSKGNTKLFCMILTTPKNNLVTEEDLKSISTTKQVECEVEPITVGTHNRGK